MGLDVGSIVALLAGGVLAGFLAGFFGVGGGIILVPILLWSYQAAGVSSLVATHLAFGTSLFVIVFAASASTFQYNRNGHVVWRAVAFLAAASVAGAFLGGLLAGGLPGKTLQRIFGAVVALSALRLLADQRKPKGDRAPNMNPVYLAGTGALVGVVSSLAGVGGGVIIIPILYSILRFPLKKALGTSSATIVVTAVAAAAGYVVRGAMDPLVPSGTLGYVDILRAVPLIVGTVPLGLYGASVADRTHPTTLRRVFAMLLVIVALRMLLF